MKAYSYTTRKNQWHVFVGGLGPTNIVKIGCKYFTKKDWDTVMECLRSVADTEIDTDPSGKIKLSRLEFTIKAQYDVTTYFVTKQGMGYMDCPCSECKDKIELTPGEINHINKLVEKYLAQQEKPK